MSIRTLLSAVQKSNAATIGVSVGSYELSGKTKTEVINVLIRGALQSITSALLHLQERTGRPRPLLPIADLSNGNSSTINAADSPNNNLLTTLSQTDLHSSLQPLRQTLRPSAANMGCVGTPGAENIRSLLNTLQSTMQAMKQDLRMSI